VLTKKLIENRIYNFWGYGNLQSDVWFIGMEEGFGGTLLDLENRFLNTKDKSVMDIQNGYEDVKDHFQWFLKKPKIQRTWSKLILILLSLNSEDKIDNKKIRKYQRTEFARANSNHCSLEFMPLPCRSTNAGDWFYGQFGIEFLGTRKEYLEKIMPLRIRLFQGLIEKYAPKTIIFYSLSYLDYWKNIIGHELMGKDSPYYYNNGKSKFFVIPHPVAHGMTNLEWVEIANKIKSISIS